MLGVDNIPAHKTTSFSKGSHFQFFQYDNDSVLQGEELIEYAKKVYLRDNVDFLIDVLGETNVGSVFLKSIMNLMQEHRGGMVLSVLPTSLQERSKEIEVKVVCYSPFHAFECGTVIPLHLAFARDFSSYD